MRHASAVIGPSSESATRSCDGGLASLPTVVMPSRSLTTASYCRLSMRGICVVAGIPGVQVLTTLPGGNAEPPAPPAPVPTVAPFPPIPAPIPADPPPGEAPGGSEPGPPADDVEPHAASIAERTATALRDFR